MRTGLSNRAWTDEELMALPDDGRKHELVEGELIMSPTGFQHGYISLRLAAAMMDFALKRRLGIVVDSSTGFRLASGNCRSPDISFVGKERLGTGEITKKFFEGAPDLAVEVLSPEDAPEAVTAKLKEYFENGTRLAWVISPEERTVFLHRDREPAKTLKEGGTLNGEEVLPGFSFPVLDLFEVPGFGS
jgi:Uma2 family endonuclease